MLLSFFEVFVVPVLDAILDFFARGESLGAPIQVDHPNFLTAFIARYCKTITPSH
jgi:hypothetical protein